MVSFLVALLVLLSLGLIIAVPVALAIPGEWENYKENFRKTFQGWALLVVIIASIDGILAAT